IGARGSSPAGTVALGHKTQFAARGRDGRVGTAQQTKNPLPAPPRSRGSVLTHTARASVFALKMQCFPPNRSEEHTSELQSRENLVCRLPLEKKKKHPASDLKLIHTDPHSPNGNKADD